MSPEITQKGARRVVKVKELCGGALTYPSHNDINTDRKAMLAINMVQGDCGLLLPIGFVYHY